MGIRKSVDLARSAFVGSVIDSARIVARILGRESVTVPRVKEACDLFLGQVGPDLATAWKPKLDELSGPVTKEVLEMYTKKPQSELQKAVDETNWEKLITKTAANGRDRPLAQRRPRAGSWLTAFPCRSVGLWICNDQMVVAVRWWLGLVLPKDEKNLRKAGSGMYGRHHGLRDIIYESARTADLRPYREASVDSSGRRPADVFLPDFSQGRPLSIDVTVSHPSQSTITNLARGDVSASEQASVDKFAEKERLYKGLCEAQGVNFLPLPFCAYGGVLDTSDDFIRTLAGRVAERTGVAPSVAIAQLWQRLSVTLWRWNAKMVLQAAKLC